MFSKGYRKTLPDINSNTPSAPPISSQKLAILDDNRVGSDAIPVATQIVDNELIVDGTHILPVVSDKYIPNDELFMLYAKYEISVMHLKLDKEKLKTLENSLKTYEENLKDLKENCNSTDYITKYIEYKNCLLNIESYREKIQCFEPNPELEDEYINYIDNIMDFIKSYSLHKFVKIDDLLHSKAIINLFAKYPIHSRVQDKRREILLNCIDYSFCYDNFHTLNIPVFVPRK